MAVYQISRIQIRRGQANQGTGLPQLASGEMAWAIDTQELYIGNGSVSEGAPAVGNTKVLTANDLSSQAGLINSIYYTYKVTDTSVQTGHTVNTPVSRSLQDRLDDDATLTNFISKSDKDSNDYTYAIQHAINQLFLNDSGTASTTVKNRVKLKLPAGTYNTSGTIFLPSYVTLEGAGSDKTIINYNPALTVTGTTVYNSSIISSNTATTVMLGAAISGTNIPANTAITGFMSTSGSTITGTTLTVGTLTSGIITTGMLLFGPGFQPNTYIVANLAGNGTGSTWTVSKTYASTTASGQTVTGTGVILSGVYTGSIVPGTGIYAASGVLTTGNVTSGTIQVGQLITGSGIAAGTYITGNINAHNWTVNIIQTVASTTITGNGFIAITNPATALSATPITFALLTADPAFKAVCVDGNNAPSIITLTTSGNQPRNISVSGMTILTTTGTNTCLELDAVRDSLFTDIKVIGGNAGTPATFDNLSAGISLNAFSSLLTCENNVFTDIVVDGFTFGVYSYQDMLNNIFDNCIIKNSYQGFTLGYNYYSQFISTNYYISQSSVTGQNYGPRTTQIIDCKFYNIYKRAVFLGLGSGNKIENPKLVGVGNNAGVSSVPTVPQIYVYSPGNAVTGVYSDRTFLLGSSTYLTSPYIPESTGWVNADTFGIANSITINYNGSSSTSVGSLALGQLYTIKTLGSTNGTQWNTIAGTSSATYEVGTQFVCANVGTGLGNGTVYTPSFAFRLPVSTDEVGAPNGSSVYTINYSYVSTSNSFVRRGTMTISADVHNVGGTTYIYPLQLSDEYDFGGSDAAFVNSLQLDFSAVYLDASGGVYDPTDVTPPSSIQIQYNNTLGSDTGSFTYTYSVIFTKPY
jgi:hypothetical protein